MSSLRPAAAASDEEPSARGRARQRGPGGRGRGRRGALDIWVAVAQQLRRAESLGAIREVAEVLRLLGVGQRIQSGHGLGVGRINQTASIHGTCNGRVTCLYSGQTRCA